MSLGAPIDVSPSSSRVTLTVADVAVLTDHPLFPLLFADMKIFSVGFVILRNDTGIDTIMLFKTPQLYKLLLILFIRHVSLFFRHNH